MAQLILEPVAQVGRVEMGDISMEYLGLESDFTGFSG